MLFTGKPELSIDAKQRLAIPAKVRAQLEEGGGGEALFVTRGANGALWLWPQQTFEQIAGRLEPSLAPASELMDFDELTFPEAERLEIDGAGRIRIPQELLIEAGLGSRVVLAGMRHHLEIWDPEEWEARRREKESRRAEIMQRARSVTRETERPHHRPD